MEKELENSYKVHLSDAILKAFVYAGVSKYDTDDIQVIVNKCIEWITGQSYRLTEAECCEAIDKGVFKDFGDYFGINAVTVVSWFKQFREWKKYRQRPIDVSRQIEQAPKKTPAQQSLIDKSFIEDCKRKYSSTGKFRDYGQVLYDSLKRENMIELNNEIWENAAKKVFAEMSAEKSARTLSEIVKLKIECEEKDYSRIRIKQKLIENWLKKECKNIIP